MIKLSIFVIFFLSLSCFSTNWFVEGKQDYCSLYIFSKTPLTQKMWEIMSLKGYSVRLVEGKKFDSQKYNITTPTGSFGLLIDVEIKEGPFNTPYFLSKDKIKRCIGTIELTYSQNKNYIMGQGLQSYDYGNSFLSLQNNVELVTKVHPTSESSNIKQCLPQIEQLLHAFPNCANLALKTIVEVE